jgi:hypothetical protein
MSNFDSVTRAAIRRDVESALAEIGKRYGITSGVERGSYTTNNYSLKVQFITFTGEVAKKEAAGVHAGYLGLPGDVVGKKFTAKTKTFTVVGIKPNRPKNPVELKDQNGKGFKCSVDQLKRFMKI